MNNRQAVSNADDTFTVVLSNWDPGIANWVDAAGLREGIVMLRWQRLETAAVGAAGPSVHATLVKRNALWAALPAATARVTPGQRRLQLQARAVGFDRRFSPHD